MRFWSYFRYRLAVGTSCYIYDSCRGCCGNGGLRCNSWAIDDFFQLTLLSLVKIAVLVLGIVAIVYYKDDERVTPAPSVLFIVGGSVGLIPFLGGGRILTIIGGSLYFGLLKKFEIQE